MGKISKNVFCECKKTTTRNYKTVSNVQCERHMQMEEKNLNIHINKTVCHEHVVEFYLFVYKERERKRVFKCIG